MSEVMHRIQVGDDSFQCRPDTSLLIAMGRIGKKIIPVGCRAGGCGICKVRVLEGDFEAKVMSRAKVSVEEQAAGYVLACRVFPRSNMVVEPVNEE